MRKILFFSLVLMVMCVAPITQAAQPTRYIAAENIAETPTDTILSTSLNLPDELEGIVIDTIEKTPTRLGLWWRTMREQISLGLTSDPVEKTEKRVQYAEERMRIAEFLAQKADDPEVQKMMDSAIDRASVLISRLEEEKSTWEATSDERIARVLRNIVTHHIRRDRILDTIEERLPDSKQEEFIQRRSTLEEQRQRLLQTIDNEKIPEEVRKHVRSVRERIEAKAEVEQIFREKKRELMKAADNGDVNAQEKLRALREERKQTLEQSREKFQGAQQTFRAEIQERIDNKRGEPVVGYREKDSQSATSTRLSPSPAVNALRRAKEIQQRAATRKIEIDSQIDDDTAVQY